jgi:hypothetical protein
MLDVHPPHAPTHTWRDFLIHIATIVIGLLIAIGLEQTVEYFHHRHQVTETHEALRREREHNRLAFAIDTAAFRYGVETMKNNLLVLTFIQQHPGTPEEKLPGLLVWTATVGPAEQSAWLAAQQTGITSLMPRQEVADNEHIYKKLSKAGEASGQFWRAVNMAGHYAYLDPDPSHLTPAQVDQEIILTEDCIEANFRLGVELRNLNDDHPDFSPAPSWPELFSSIGGKRSEQDSHKLTIAHALTSARLAATRSALKQAEEVSAPN